MNTIKIFRCIDCAYYRINPFNHLKPRCIIFGDIYLARKDEAQCGKYGYYWKIRNPFWNEPDWVEKQNKLI